MGLGELSGVAPREASNAVRERVERARMLQQRRFASVAGVFTNARIEPRELRRFASADGEGRRLLRAAMEKPGHPVRARDRLLRVARTIADLDSSDSVHTPHLAEAIQHRPLDRPRWGEGA